MSTVVMDKQDELIMKLVHYFITEQDYTPIVVNGVKDEIWLENTKGPYRIIRINSNNIINKEQLNYDYYKIENIVKQIKKKTLSFNVNTLNILLNVNDELKITDDYKNIIDVKLPEQVLTIEDENILEAFPNINEKLLNDQAGVELILNVTKDINEKTEQQNRSFEKTFSPKKIIITPFIICACICVFLACLYFDGLQALTSVTVKTGEKLGGVYGAAIERGEYYRLFTSMFLHWSLIHLLVNMYSLYILGTQIETFFGKVRYILIYVISGICGALLTCVLSKANVISGGASGAIFGLLGALLYFGYHYRTYLGGTIKSQIVPIILINLGIGFIPGLNIDNACHIGGLFGGYLIAMALGVDDKSDKKDKINGAICLVIYIAFMLYMILNK